MTTTQPQPRTRLYSVIVTGRMNENATYLVRAANKPAAKSIARAMARSDNDNFRWTTYPQVALIETAAQAEARFMADALRNA